MTIDFTHVRKHYAPRTHDKMKEVLMDPDGIGPDVHYYMIRGGHDQKNITVWEPGTISGEYIKTYGHYHVGKLEETYWIVYGEGIAILQKLAADGNGDPIENIVEEIRILPVKAGSTVFMPSGFGHALVNTGMTFLVTIDDTLVNFNENNPVSMPGHADYLAVKRQRGFGYYVVEHNGCPALKRNTNYKEIRKSELNGLPIIK